MNRAKAFDKLLNHLDSTKDNGTQSFKIHSSSGDVTIKAYVKGFGGLGGSKEYEILSIDFQGK